MAIGIGLSLMWLISMAIHPAMPPISSHLTSPTARRTSSGPVSSSRSRTDRRTGGNRVGFDGTWISHDHPRDRVSVVGVLCSTGTCGSYVGEGFVFAEVFDVLHVSVEPKLDKVVAEITLVWVLFGDASSVRLSDFRRDLTVYMRLLGVGLPLTVVLGTLIAVALLGFGVWPALLVGAALAPTDAALGASVMSNPDVPLRIRRVLNVESGLNDGIATPIVLVAIAGVAADEPQSGCFLSL
jgi:hypothetical protein